MLHVWRCLIGFADDSVARGEGPSFASFRSCWFSCIWWRRCVIMCASRPSRRWNDLLHSTHSNVGLAWITRCLFNADEDDSNAPQIWQKQQHQTSKRKQCSLIWRCLLLRRYMLSHTKMVPLSNKQSALSIYIKCFQDELLIRSVHDNVPHTRSPDP